MSDYLSQILGPDTYTYALIAGAPAILLIGWMLGKFVSTRISARRRASDKPESEAPKHEDIAALKRRLDRVNIEVDVYLHQADIKRIEGTLRSQETGEQEQEGGEDE